MNQVLEAPGGYVVDIKSQPTGYDWTVISADGRTASGHAPSPGSASCYCDFTISTLEAFRRLGRRRF